MIKRRRVLWTLALMGLGVFVLSASSVFAQTPSEKQSSATIAGMVVDSLHRDYLKDAVLTVEGSPARATTDSVGRFRLEGVQPGLRRVEVLHPLLDTIGVVLQTAPLKLSAGHTVTLLLATPSAETLVA